MKKEYRIKVLNKYVDSRNLELINDFVGERFWCNAIYNDEGLVTDDPKASTVLHLDDEIVIECEERDAKTVIGFIGKEFFDIADDGGPMTRDKALIKLRKLQKSHDTEVAHCSADTVLCDLLKTLGFEDVVHEYYQVDKWYS